MSRKKQCTPVPVIGRTGTATIRSYTKFTKQLATLSLALLWLSILSAATPSYVLPHNSKDEVHVLPQCDSTYLFISDTLLSHTYFDSKRRKSTITFCPQSSEQGVEVQFLDFDVAEGDTLIVYDGKDKTYPIIGQASGQGNNNAFGGKICGPHSSTNNREGCLTFVFQTNGDRITGTGWQATVSCAKKKLEIILPDIPSQQLVCGTTSTIISIPPAQLINKCGPLNNDYTLVKIKETTTGTSCGETILSANANSVFTHPFGIGTFQIDYISVIDPALSGSVNFTIAPTPLVCEAEMRLTTSSTCNLVLLPEMFVKEYCPPIANKLHYNIVVRHKDGSIVANGSSLNDDYPSLPLNTMELCGNTAYLVEVQQVYTKDTTNTACAKNRIVQTCTVPLVITDDTPPTFMEPAQVDTLFACQLNLQNMLELLTTPITLDACGVSQVQLKSILPYNGENKCTEQPDYIVTWIASDLCGNSSTRIDTLKVHRPKIVQNFTVLNIAQSCETNLDISTIEMGKLPYLQEGMQVNGHFQPTNKIELSFTEVTCNYQLRKEEIVRLTTCGKEVVRSWSILDKCSTPQITIPLEIQIIQLIDTLAPAFTNCSNFATRATAEQIDLPADSCQITLDFPLPTATDNCDDKPIVKEFTVQELVNGEWSTKAISLFQTPLSMGTFRVGYETVDDCEIGGNADTCFRYFVIKNPITPIINCSEFSTLVTAEQFDLPSNNCEINLNFPLPSVLGSCNNSIVQEDAVQELINGQWNTIATTLTQTSFPVGTYRVAYILNTNNTEICYRYFAVIDPIKPAINCSTFSTLATAEQYNLPSNNCEINLNFPLPIVLDNCDNISARELGVQELINDQWTTITNTLVSTPFSAGTFRVGYTFGINTNSDICYRYFIIQAPLEPTINCNAFSTLATAEQFDLPTNSCQISLNFPLPIVLDNCDNISARELGVQELINDQWTTIANTLASTPLPAGTFRVGYTFGINTNTDICYRYFIVRDPIKPAFTCSAFSTLATAELFDLPTTSCQISLNFPLPIVLDNCDNISARELGVQELIDGQWSTIANSLALTPLPAGTFRVGYTFGINTNSDICYRYFIIRNPIAPTINCSVFSTLATAEQFDVSLNNCQTNLNFSLPTVLNNCDNISVRELGVQELINNQWTSIATSLAQTPLSTGTFRVGYTIGTDNTTDTCYRYFIISNPITPSIDCSVFSTLATAEQIDLPANICQISLNFPLPSFTGNCANQGIKEVAVQELTNEQWTIKATALSQMAFPADTFRVAYTLGTDTCYRYFIVRDTIAPFVTCRQDILISLDENSSASLDASALSLAQGDNCSNTQLLIKRASCLEGDMRMETDTSVTSNRIDLSEWATSIDFACCDLGKTIRMELLVIDESGNYSTCSATTVPTESILPICEALPPVIGFCNEYQTTDFGRPTDVNGNEAFDLLEWLPILPEQTRFYNEQFGEPMTACRDNITCLNLKIEQEYQLIEDRCNSIRVKRRYRAVDFSNNVSPWMEQVISIEYRPDWLITFPADAFTNCEADKITAPVSPIKNGPCDRLSWTATDEVVEFTTGGILEVIRTFTVINNCVSQSDDQWEELVRIEDEQGIVRTDLLVRPTDYPGEGHFSYIQKIRIVDTDAPFLVLGTVDTLLYGKGDAEPFGEEDLTREAFPFECDEIREFSVFARDCNEPSTETLRYNWEFSNNGKVIQTGIGNSFFQTVLPDTLYTINWMVVDVFGNQSDTSVTYQFVDAAPPTPVCAKGITANISPTTRMVTINADTLDGGSFDNCDDQTELHLYVWNNLMRIDTPQTLPEIQALPTEFLFNCTDTGRQEILLFVSDVSGNFAACSTIIELLADSTINCDETMIGGTIVDRFGVPIPNTNITFFGQDQQNTIQSNTAGNYDMMLPTHADYTIRPSITTKPLNGISTYDLVLLSQHILGNNFFTSPYQYIAGDVNRSGSITAFDLVQLRQLILYQIKEFPNNDSWRFINADYQFKTASPLSENIQETYNITNLSTENVYMDFIGVKVGDVSGDASTSNLQQVQQRQFGTNLNLYTTNQRLEKGKFYTVPFHAPQLENIIGFQGTFKFHDLILTNINGGMVTPEHFYGWRQESIGYLTTSWHSLYSHDNNTAPFLFSLTFQATTDGLLNELLEITSDPTTAEAYSFSGERLNLSLTFQNKDRKNDLNFGIPSPPSSSKREPIAMLPLEGGAFEVFPNKPNPFDDYTIISFYIAQPTLTALSVFNIHGQSILQTQQIYPKGTNQIKFDSDQIPNGTYFYQVATSFGVATHKMVVAR